MCEWVEYAKPMIVYHNLSVAGYYEVRAALPCVRWGDVLQCGVCGI